MVKKRREHWTSRALTVEKSPVTLSLEEEAAFAELRSNLAEISKIQGVTGYILRNSTTAIIDLKNPEKLVEYALLSSEAADCSHEISKLFNLGTVETVVEGRGTKMLCKTLGENELSIFAERSVDHADIFRRVSP
jgi:hypothetical protein